MKKLQTTRSTDRENLENVSVLALSPPASAITMCNILLFYRAECATFCSSIEIQARFISFVTIKTSVALHFYYRQYHGHKDGKSDFFLAIHLSMSVS